MKNYVWAGYDPVKCSYSYIYGNEHQVSMKLVSACIVAIPRYETLHLMTAESESFDKRQLN
jgi:hypothetical protein